MKRNLLFLSILLLITLTLASCAPASPSEPASEPVTEPVVETTQSSDQSAAAELAATQDAAFLDTVVPVNENVESYLGQEVTVSGFVLYRDSFDNDDFMVTRLVVDCCIDDAAATGFVTQWAGEAPAADEWVEVTGIIDQREVEDITTGMTFMQPYLIASSLEIIEPYESEYLFLSTFQ